MSEVAATAEDHRTAHRLAEEAGALLLALRAGFEAGGDSAALRREGDRRSHELLVARLGELRRDDAVLSEEGVADPARLSSRRVWIVDPLDGTREFGEPPRTDWAVHVALCVDGTATAGAVALPAQGLTLSTATMLPPLPRAGDPPRIAASRTRPPALVGALTAALGGVVVPMGSAGAKAMAVLQGTVDVYVHAGGQYEWDSAAPAAVAMAAGLHVSRLDGSPLVYNRPDPLLPDLVICRPELAQRVLELLAQPDLAGR